MSIESGILWLLVHNPGGQEECLESPLSVRGSALPHFRCVALGKSLSSLGT